MAFAIIHFFPGGTQAQYEATVKVAHGGNAGNLPAGQTFHAAGAVAGGWTIFAIHDSKASWEKFRDGTLVPAMQAGIEGGFAGPPEETEIELFSVTP
jgi:hypothetical protein